MAGGTGQKFTYATTIVAGIASVAATLLSAVSIWLQAKNYRKPLLQRYVVRILLMVPIYSISSWCSMVSTDVAQFLDPIRDIYEAFTIYTFFQLLINYLGGERSLIIMTHGREPVHHLWPLNHILPPVDISDPYTFLAIKRGILQYAWLKPVLGFSAIIMKATGVYQEGYIGLNSGYFWSGIVYNVSVTVSLYTLGLFWVCMHHDLKPFRPVPKFLCIKLIIFASYWQGFFLSILVWLGALPDDVSGYTPDNLAAAIQDALICIEMPIFAVAHWYAFSWHDFADNSISCARLPVKFALRDAFGVRDLIQDSRETFSGDQYAYRAFDSGDKIMAHEASKSRMARLKAGMRYERGGKGKYWIPSPDEINAKTPLLGGDPLPDGLDAAAGPSTRRSRSQRSNGALDEPITLDPEEEGLYDKARKLEFGDWNYPVVTANLPSGERWLTSPRPSLYHARSGGSVSSSTTQGPSQKQTEAAPLSTTVLPKKKKRKQKDRVRSHQEIVTPSTPQEVVPVHHGETEPAAQQVTNTEQTVDLMADEPPHSTDPVDQVGQGIEESRGWERDDVSPVEVSPRFGIENEDEFRNVWGNGEEPGAQPRTQHL